MEPYIFTLALIIGYILDLLLGDPRWLPHPIVLFGNAIAKGEKALNKGKNRKVKGLFIVLLYVFICLSVFGSLSYFLFDINTYAYVVYASIFVFYGIANNSLIFECKEVAKALSEKGLEAGRKRLSWIVGRDTSKLSPEEIKTAVLETLSENLSDGVVAPLFYYAIAGIPGIMVYKLVNTFDSMIGYKSERYKDFGWFAANLDDVLNYIPARITAFMIVAVSLSWRSVRFIFKYARKHSSPNAGYPESALAGLLNCRFGGPNVYHGKLVDKPYIGENHKELTDKDMKRSFFINHKVTFLLVVLLSVGLYFLNGLLSQ